MLTDDTTPSAPTSTARASSPATVEGGRSVSIGDLLVGVNPCDAGPCGSQTRTVVGYGVGVPGLYDVRCVRCGSVSSMRPTVAASCLAPTCPCGAPATKAATTRGAGLCDDCQFDRTFGGE